MVLPVLVALTLGLAWLLARPPTLARAVAAAGAPARPAARDDGAGTAEALGRRVAPDGAWISVRDDGETVVVSVRSTVHGPHGLFGFLPGVDVDAEAVAAKEPG